MYQEWRLYYLSSVEQSEIFIILLSWSLFLYRKKMKIIRHELYPLHLPLSQHLLSCHCTNHQSKSCLSSQASHPFIGSLPYLLWGLHQLLSLSHCTRSECRGITCIVHCYSPTVSLWHLADRSKCSANVAWLKVFNLFATRPMYTVAAFISSISLSLLIQ